MSSIRTVAAGGNRLPALLLPAQALAGSALRAGSTRSSLRSLKTRSRKRARVLGDGRSELPRDDRPDMYGWTLHTYSNVPWTVEHARELGARQQQVLAGVPVAWIGCRAARHRC